MASRFLNPLLEQRVILGAVSDDLQQDDNLEPPMVRIREQNSAYIYIDSSFTLSDTPANVIIGYRGGDLFTRKVKRFAVKGLEMSWVTPNINPRNNTIIVALDSLATTFTATIPTGFYSTVVDLFNALVTALNTATSTTFTITQTYPGAESYTLANAGHTFVFVGGNMFVQGQFMFGFVPGSSPTTLQASYVLSSTSLSYTRWVNFNSNELTQYTKLPLSGIDTNSTCITKLYVISDGAQVDTIFFNIEEPLAWINYKKDSNITAIDVQLYDEWGQYLYIPPEYNNSFYFALIISTQL